ncbi:MAG: hypothetical protein KAT43_06265 [Nanoarchaeota archaeon]|nr:hypothetical protein [Nanoarchaeota archaeon]
MEKPEKEQKVQKQLLLRAVFTDKGQGMRLDLQKSRLNTQEAIGVLEIAKTQLLNELAQNQMTVKQDSQ